MNAFLFIPLFVASLNTLRFFPFFYLTKFLGLWAKGTLLLLVQKKVRWGLFLLKELPQTFYPPFGIGTALPIRTSGV